MPGTGGSPGPGGDGGSTSGVGGTGGGGTITTIGELCASDCVREAQLGCTGYNAATCVSDCEAEAQPIVVACGEAPVLAMGNCMEGVPLSSWQCDATGNAVTQECMAESLAIAACM